MLIKSWGCELEFGDVDRSRPIPEHLGTWNVWETDIVNQREPYWGIAADPAGIDPPVGGEINTRPTQSIAEQVRLISELIAWLGNPTSSCVSNTHIHIHVPDLNISEFLRYVVRNQMAFIEAVYDFKADSRMTQSGLQYLLMDSGRAFEPQKFDMIRRHAPTVGFIPLYILNNSAFDRYAINLTSLWYNKTIEFRCFRASTDVKEIANCLMAVDIFMKSYAQGKPIVADELKKMSFPKLNYNHELFESWERTKKPRGVPGTKTHSFIEV
jgi:hypothetical protein